MASKKRSPIVLTERDVAILCDLARYRYLSTTQAATLHFPSHQTTNSRLARLEEAGYLKRFRPRAVPGHGSTEFICHLTKSGAELVAYQREVNPSEIRYPKEKRDPRHGWRMDHMLGIVQFWLSLDVGCPKLGVRLKDFIPEWHCTKNGTGFTPTIHDETPHLLRTSEMQGFLPDAAFILERSGREALFFLEVDRKTETVKSQSWPDFTDKLLSYASYRQHGGFRRRFGNFQGFRTLVTTLTPGRVNSYQEAADTLGLRDMFLFALADDVAPETILNPVWRRGDPADTTQHALIAAEPAP